MSTEYYILESWDVRSGPHHSKREVMRNMPRNSHGCITVECDECGWDVYDGESWHECGCDLKSVADNASRVQPYL